MNGLEESIVIAFTLIRDANEVGQCYVFPMRDVSLLWAAILLIP